MTDRSRQIAIAGAGIAGLTAALAFAQRGFSVTVHERAKRLDEVGAGLQLSPNATRILSRLGVIEALDPVAVRPEAVDIRSARSLRPIASVPLGKAAERRWGAPYLAVHRADLHGVLLTAALRHDAVTVRTAATVRGASASGGRVVLSVESGGQVEDAAFDLAVGADGVWSTLRGLGGRERPSRFTGHVAWRAMARPQGNGRDFVPMDRVTTFLHPGFHLVAYPVRAGAAVNLVAMARGPDSPRGWSNEGDRERLDRAMKGASPALVRLVGEAGPWTTWPIHEVAQDGPWTDPAGIALIGDAAHAMGPYAAQGAAMAIEDAAALAAAVAARPDDLPSALSAYERIRRERAARVARRGAFNRFAWHAAGPVALARNVVLSLRAPESLAADLDWLYGYDAEEGEW